MIQPNAIDQQINAAAEAERYPRYTHTGKGNRATLAILLSCGCVAAALRN
jgi:hypothetical protein